MEHPLCLSCKTLLDERVFTDLGLDKGMYFGVFSELQEYWEKRFPGPSTYALCAIRNLGKVLNTPDEWLEVGRVLADATTRAWTNGSHSFVENSVPSLIDLGLFIQKVKYCAG